MRRKKSSIGPLAFTADDLDDRGRKQSAAVSEPAMKNLSFGVAAIGLLAFELGLKADDGWEVGLGISALICAVTTYLSAGISSYLKIFAGIFSIETIASGLLTIVIKAGLWPAVLADYT